MSITLADAVVFLRGDDSKLKQSLGDAQGKVGSFVGGATKLLGGALLGGATLAAGAIAGIGAAAFDVSNQTATAAADMAAALGIPTEEAEKFADVARQVYGNNFANDVGDAASAVTELARQLGLTADDPSLKTLTENAFRLRDSFGVDVADSVSTVKTLMDNFGLSADEAFNMLAAGYQKGLDRSGDFLDTVNEYSTQFANGGASASEFFSLMESGLQGGMLGTDKAADAFKEFRLRIQDGSTATKTGLELIGLSFDDINARLANGTLTAADAFALVTQRLKDTEDPTKRMQAGAALIGSQFEDLGDAAATALTMTTDWASGSEGAISSLDAKYKNFGDVVGGIWRRLTTSISPFTDKLLDLVNDAMPSVMSAFDAFDQNVVPIIENLGALVGRVVDFVSGLFKRDLTGAVGEGNAIFELLRQRVDEIMPYIQTIITSVLGFIQSFWESHGETIMGVVNNTFTTVSTVITTVLDVILQAVKLVLQLITGDFEGAGETLQSIVETIWRGIKKVFETQLDSIKKIVGSFDLAAAGRAIIDSLRKGIENKWEGLKSWFKDKLEGLRNLLPFSEPKDPGSPLRNLSAAGRGITEQIQKGLNDLDSGFLRPVATAATAGGGGAMAIQITQNFYGPADEGIVRRAAQQGLAEALRQRGIS